MSACSVTPLLEAIVSSVQVAPSVTGAAAAVDGRAAREIVTISALVREVDLMPSCNVCEAAYLRRV